MGIAFLVFGLLLLGGALHPFVTYPWSLRFFTPRSTVIAPTDFERPSVAVCVCAYNEEAVIGWKARSLIAMAQTYGPAEILVYVDGAEDRTASILEGFGDDLRLVVSGERRGKSAGMAQLVAASRSELVAFTDANVDIPQDGLVRLAAAFQDRAVGCATAILAYSNARETTAAGSGADYWSLEERIKARESRTIGVIGVDGAFFMMRRGDYRPPPPDIIDDLYCSLTVLAAGRAVVSQPDVVVSERGAVSDREEFRRKARIACQAMNVHRLMWPTLSRMRVGQLYGYVSHRLMKWLTPYSLALSAIFCSTGLAMIVGPAPVAILGLLGLGGFGLALALKLRPAKTLASHLTSLAGVGLGVYQSVMLNRRYVTWTPADSVRD